MNVYWWKLLTKVIRTMYVADIIRILRFVRSYFVVASSFQLGSLFSIKSIISVAPSSSKSEDRTCSSIESCHGAWQRKSSQRRSHVPLPPRASLLSAYCWTSFARHCNWDESDADTLRDWQSRSLPTRVYKRKRRWCQYMVQWGMHSGSSHAFRTSL